MFILQKKWFTRVALSGVLLTNSLVGIAPSQAAVLNSKVTPMVTKLPSTVYKNSPVVVSQSKAYSQAIRVAFHWTSSIESNMNEPQITSKIISNQKESITPVVSKTPALVKTLRVPPINKDTKKKSTSAQKVSNIKPKQASMPQVSRGSLYVDKLISHALSLQGIPYLWGGTSIKGFDCSGFVQHVFRASGISLPRTAAEQYKLGSTVSRNNLRPGDLVFFQTYAPGATDVRIYIGGGQTVGASSDGVGIHNLSESYWSKHYLGARRIL
ncbi:C40 family peptidase [Desulfosporosinus sp. FKA]|uniref:C40 family peptidase n=1 Tax=Desulfosporosinus sp. FKA TaxID=1969834 RepID=UPI001FA8E261|nr:C40 family peptidase [Desulfosporosinus sp. FKA]